MIKTTRLLTTFTTFILLLITTSSLHAHQQMTYHLFNAAGSPVLSQLEGVCVDTQTPNQPRKPLKICGDIIDTDQDGVFDDQDNCPYNTSAEIALGVNQLGCPIDSDGDGVPDFLDKCPKNNPLEISQGVTPLGCPKDSDQDGIPDFRDRCPNTAFGQQVDSNGCKKVTRQIRKIIASDVLFEFNKAQLAEQGEATLQQLAKEILSQITYIQNIVVIGHTDDIGSDAYNQRLSEQRADSVADFLVQQGLAESKLRRRGEGEAIPIASNATKEGRAQNRRVEIEINMNN